MNALLQKAGAFLRQHQYAQAIELYEKILTREPAAIEAYRGIVAGYSGIGDPQGALIFLETLYLDNSESAEINYGLGYALFSDRKYKDAARYFDRAIQLNSKLPEAWNNRAAIYQFVENNVVKAREFYEKSIALAKQSGNQRVLEIAQKNMSHLPREEKLVPVTEQLGLEQFLNRFVAATQEHDHKALRRLVLGQRINSQQAMNWFLEEALKASVQGSPNQDNTALILAQALEKTYGEFFDDTILKDMLDGFERLSLQERREMLKAAKLIEKGVALEQRNAVDEAVQRYQEALGGYKRLGAKRKTGITYAYLGDAYGKLSQYPQARKAYLDALPFFNLDMDTEYKARLLASLGQTYFKMGHYQDALENMEMSLTIYARLHNKGAAEKLTKNIEIVKKRLRN